MLEFGRLLKIIRVNNGETAKMMAGKLFISPSYLSSIESGTRKVPVNLIEMITETYNLTPYEEVQLHEAVIGGDISQKINFDNCHNRKKKLIFAILQDNLSKEIFNKIYNLAFDEKMIV